MPCPFCGREPDEALEADEPEAEAEPVDQEKDFVAALERREGREP